jgi:hypothetical protein
VQSPQLDVNLAEALQREGIVTTRNNDHALWPRERRRSGSATSRSPGVAIHELVTEGSSLEEVFLDLTSEGRQVNQLRAELLKIRSTRTTIGLLVGLIAPGAALHHPDVHVVADVPTRHRARSNQPAELREHRGRLRRAGGRHALHQRVPFRDHSTDVAVQSESKSTLRRHKITAGVLSGSSLASSVRVSSFDRHDDLEDPRRLHRHDRRQHDRADRRRDRRDGVVGRHRCRARRDRPQPSRRRDRLTGVGLRR